MRHKPFQVDLFLKAGPYVQVHLSGRVQSQENVADPATATLVVACDKKTPSALVTGAMICEIRTALGRTIPGKAAPLKGQDGKLVVHCAKGDWERALAA